MANSKILSEWVQPPEQKAPHPMFIKFEQDGKDARLFVRCGPIFYGQPGPEAEFKMPAAELRALLLKAVKNFNA